MLKQRLVDTLPLGDSVLNASCGAGAHNRQIVLLHAVLGQGEIASFG